MTKKLLFRTFRAALTILLTSGCLWAQTTVTGKISDENGQPVPGVNIIEKGTTTGTSSNTEGHYTTTTLSENAVLIFSFVGYVTQEVPVNNRNTIDIQLSPDTKQLGEIVVVGYGTQQKKDLTGSIASADLAAFKESPNVSILQSLKGSLPGLTIGQTNQAGQEAAINIRGTSTLNGNTNPLIIVDGIIFNGRLSDINPSDVASADVLKDPSSKAVYGSQAANGVILITTKTGKVGQKPSITYSGSYAASSPTIRARLLDRDAYLQKVRDIEYLDAYTEASGYTEKNPDWDFSNSEMWSVQLAGIAAQNNIDWWGSLTQPALITNHSLEISGGSDKASYFLAGGYTNEKGYIKNDNYKRYTLRLNLDTQVADFLTVGSNLSGTISDFSGDSPTMARITGTTPLVSPTDENGEYVINPVGDLNLNPFLAYTNDNYEVQSRLVANLYAVLQVPGISGLSYRLNFGNNLKFFKDYGSSIYDAGRTGAAYKNDANQYEQTLDNIVNFSRSFGKHKLDLTAVYGYNTGRYDRTAATGSNFTDLDLSYNNLGLAAIQTITSSAWKEALLYQVMSAAYNFDGKYLLKGTLRRDGYSGFSKKHKTAVFPSIGFGWVVSEEGFFDVPAIRFLKIRGSYGENGNKAERYSSLARIVTADGSKYVFGDGGSTAIGRSINTLANNDLRWERTRGINIGLDFELFGNKLDGNIEYYNSNTTDLLWSQALPETSGFSEVLTNLGKINNKGFEFMLHSTPVSNRIISWDVAVNFSSNRNKIVRLLNEDLDGDGNEDDLISSGLFIGKSIGTLYNYQASGIWNVGEEVMTGFLPGSYRVVDQDGDGKISPDNDRVFLGRSEPAFQFGVQNALTFNRFTLRFFVSAIQGGKNGYLSANHPTGNLGTKGNATNSNWFDFYQMWSPRTPDAKYPNPWVVSSVSSSARAFYQRNFVRLQDVSLAYNFDNNLISKIGARHLKLYISAKNPLTLTKWDGWDPETGQGITSTNAYPVMKSYSLGLELTF